ncbi:MAG: ring-cleaving dioxygenase [Alphaproteobacteria bacterium]|nr:ring-cleaving dioxygenase [Alphaproteobacteria bacterium]
MQLIGIHHLTAITANASANHDFYTRVLGLRMVKKTVNQDDVSAYHLFYADGKGSPGSDITFFEWPLPPASDGRQSISRTAFRVPSESVVWWSDRLGGEGVVTSPIVERAGRKTLEFADPEGQRLAMVADDPADHDHLWAKSTVPDDHQVIGLGPITLTLAELGPTERVLTEVLNMHKIKSVANAHDPETQTHVFQMGEGGAAAELHVSIEPGLPLMNQGSGGVHHVAFRVPNQAYDTWAARLVEHRMPSSGPIDRFYFKSLYFREPGGVLFELATDGPGFAADEPLESMGERLSLPPFLEARRVEIEAGLKPIV